MNELYQLKENNQNINFKKGTGTISDQNNFSINDLEFQPNEVWFLADKPSFPGRLIAHATKDGAEYWATAANKNYYGVENNLSITNNGFNYIVTGWGGATVNWIAIK